MEEELRLEGLHNQITTTTSLSHNRHQSSAGVLHHLHSTLRPLTTIHPRITIPYIYTLVHSHYPTTAFLDGSQTPLTAHVRFATAAHNPSFRFRNVQYKRTPALSLASGNQTAVRFETPAKPFRSLHCLAIELLFSGVVVVVVSSFTLGRLFFFSYLLRPLVQRISTCRQGNKIF